MRAPASGPARRTVADRGLPRTLLLACLCALPASVSAVVEDVPTRGTVVRVLVEGPAEPAAVAVLFAGGHGALDISEYGAIDSLRGNFLIRSRGLFHAAGLATAVIDAPQNLIARGLFHFRDTTEHAEDVGAVIARLRASFDIPIWLVGTSRGTSSVANAAVRLREDGADGIVLTASMLTVNRNGTFLLAMDLDRIAIPTLIAHHEKDSCSVTPFSEVDALKDALVNAPEVHLLTYTGGSARGNPCQAHHYHGFNEIESEVVEDIAEWIRARAR